jgi:hypothetical protein
MEGEFIKIFQKVVYADGFHNFFLLLSMKRIGRRESAVMRIILVSMRFFF